MSIDLLTLAGLGSIVFYLAAFAWFGRETLWVDEEPALSPTRARPVPAYSEATCEDRA
jgi:hypothetical protein